jgi:hypothetical protein
MGGSEIDLLTQRKEHADEDVFVTPGKAKTDPFRMYRNL